LFFALFYFFYLTADAKISSQSAQIILLFLCEKTQRSLRLDFKQIASRLYL
jgi:hypothetical protein